MTHHYKMQLIPKFIFESDRTNLKPPIIEINSNDKKQTYIGRNSKTQIKTSIISRQLCTVEVSNTGAMSLIMRKDPNFHNVILDGQKIVTPIGVRSPIYNGSILSLYNDQYRYTVKLFDAMTDTGIITSNPQCPPIATTTSTTATAKSNNNDDNINEEEANKITSSIKSTMIDELICSICMNVICKATVISPCGHLYCKQCIEECTKHDKNACCPKCRGNVKGLVQVPSTDTTIFCMIRAGEFEMDDTNDFLRRSGKQLSKVEEQLMNLYHKNKNLVRIEDTTTTKQQKNHRKRKRNNTTATAATTIPPSDIILLDDDNGVQPTTSTSSGNKIGGNTKEDAIAIE